MEVIQNFLSKEAHDKIKTVMCNYDKFDHVEFPWYLSRNVASTESNNDKEFYMYHPFYWDHAPASQWFNELLLPLMQELQPRSLMRVKGNLYPGTETILEHEPHVDDTFSHRGALYFVNTNDGYTTLNDGTKVNSVENSVLLFDPSEPHFSSTCTDDKFRVTINVNYF